ncbi:hypothetical protein L2E82_49859 [Cichorium intybus]|uniref:Uncharacterized protein n=1 Tax=Cichorium intybus TaxID=13427 RepID=A0ACB8Z1R9_CICIN|nr:hypothetical protein L2E82_49859 [Cichorium intybus]
MNSLYRGRDVGKPDKHLILNNVAILVECITKNTASRLVKDQAKVMPVGGQKEVTKKQGNCIQLKLKKVVDKSENKGKKVSETSGVKKGKMKVVDKSNTKKQKGAEKKYQQGID